MKRSRPRLPVISSLAVALVTLAAAMACAAPPDRPATAAAPPGPSPSAPTAPVRPFPSPTTLALLTPVARASPTPPPPGTNTVRVGHLFNILAAAGISLPEGGAAIFEPLGDAGFRLLAVVLSEEWTSLAGTGSAPGRLVSSRFHVATPDREPCRQHNAARAGPPRPGSVVVRESPANSQPSPARHERAGGAPGALLAIVQRGDTRQ